MSEIEEKIVVIQQKSKHENELISQRLSWLGTFQGFLFAALAFAYSSVFLTTALGVVGILISVSVGAATVRANKTINKVEKEYSDLNDPKYSEYSIIGYKNKQGFFWWLMPGYFIPWCIVGVWLSILGWNLFFR